MGREMRALPVVPAPPRMRTGAPPLLSEPLLARTLPASASWIVSCRSGRLVAYNVADAKALLRFLRNAYFQVVFRV